MLFDEWIEQAYAAGASDLHLEVGTPVVVRIRGVQTVGQSVAGDTLVQVSRNLRGEEGWVQFTARGSADLSASIGGIRWMHQVTDWVRPPPAAASRKAGEVPMTRAPSSVRAPQPSSAGSAPAAPQQAPAAASPSATRARASAPGPAEEVIEVPEEEMDLAALAELAKKVVERKP